MRRLRHVLGLLRPRPRQAAWLGLGLLLAVLGGGVTAWLLRPDADIAAAERALERHDFDEARRCLHRSLERHPDSARAHFLAARAARRGGDPEEAGEHLRVCQRLAGPSDAVTLERALVRAQRGDPQVEEYLLTRVAQGDPDTLLIWEVLIQRYLDTYQLGKARDCLNQYLERRPDDVRALLGQGYVSERLFLYPEAVQVYRRAVAAEPENDGARLRLAETLLITGPPEDAAGQFERLRQRHPDSAAARLGLARAWRRQGRTAEAGQLLDALLAEQPQNVACLTERGRVALDEGALDQAGTWLRQAVTRAPNDREALYNLCRCLGGRAPDAEGRDYQARLARIDADLKRLGELTKVVLQTPHDPAPRCEAGLIFLRNSQEEEGVRWLQMALNEDSAYRPAHRALADHYQRTGRAELAARHRRLADGVGPAASIPGGASGGVPGPAK